MLGISQLDSCKGGYRFLDAEGDLGWRGDKRNGSRIIAR
jgi:hypothetical protein